MSRFYSNFVNVCVRVCAGVCEGVLRVYQGHIGVYHGFLNY